MLDYARKDRVLDKLRLTHRPDSRDAALMAGAFELLLIYRAFVKNRVVNGKEYQKTLPWTLDMDSEV